MRIVIAGGTGLVGRALIPALAARGYAVTVLSRSPAHTVPDATTALWSGTAVDEGVLDGAHAVVNLAGESLGGARWTGKRKQRILSSRVDSTAALVRAIGHLRPEARPRVYVGASGIGYLGDRGDEELDEDAAAGRTFLSAVCTAWEGAALEAESLGLRVVLMRTALAIDRHALAFRMLVLPFRLFAGGRIGSGRQWLPWIHLADLVRLYVCAIEDDALQGPVHAVAPEQLRQQDVARAVAGALRRPALVPAPAWALRLALGEQAQLVLDSQRASSRKLRRDAFLYPRLDDALREALG